MSQYLDKDGASRIAENFLLKQSEQDAILENLRFDLKEAEHALVKTIQGPAPLNIRALTRPLDDYRISGNTVQDGTPSPGMPVDVVGCGIWDETQQSYKLPLTIGGTEYPIYLGQVETTRRVKKLALTGEENWTIVSGRLCVLRPADCKRYSAIVSTHFIQTQTAANPGEMYVGGSYINFNYDGVNDNVPAFKSYLAAQYANGTPVTIWYVLATAETGIVNEPLMKIGNYADTVSFTQAGVEISTTKGFNTITTDTTVLPSNIEVKGVINNA